SVPAVPPPETVRPFADLLSQRPPRGLTAGDRQTHPSGVPVCIRLPQRKPADDMAQKPFGVVCESLGCPRRRQTALAHRHQAQGPRTRAQARHLRGLILSVRLSDPPFGEAGSLRDLLDQGRFEIARTGQIRPLADRFQQNAIGSGQLRSLLLAELSRSVRGRPGQDRTEAPGPSSAIQFQQGGEFLHNWDGLATAAANRSLTSSRSKASGCHPSGNHRRPSPASVKTSGLRSSLKSLRTHSASSWWPPIPPQSSGGQACPPAMHLGIEGGETKTSSTRSTCAQPSPKS